MKNLIHRTGDSRLMKTITEEMKTTETIINCYLIDPPTRSIRTVKLEEPNRLSFLQGFLGCKRIISLSVPGIPGHRLYLDDAGWHRERLPLPSTFLLSGHSEPLPGRAVVFHLGNDGSDQSVSISIEEMRSRVTFLDATESARAIAAHITPFCAAPLKRGGPALTDRFNL
jgi:hypothetical protein